MPDAVTSTALGLVSSVVIAALTYWFTKRREQEAERRKEKLVYYKAFVESLGGIVEGDDTPEGLKNPWQRNLRDVVMAVVIKEI
jgi:hypothetical protein